jgi:hypothetical protein
MNSLQSLQEVQQVMDNIQKAAMLRAWASQVDRRNGSLRDVIYIRIWADRAAAGTLLEPSTIPVHWPRELEHRREILDVVLSIQSAMTPDGAAMLTPWIDEINAAIVEADRMVSASSSPAQAKIPSV